MTILGLMCIGSIICAWLVCFVFALRAWVCRPYTPPVSRERMKLALRGRAS